MAKSIKIKEIIIDGNYYGFAPEGWAPKFDGDWILWFRKCARRTAIHPRDVLDVPNIMTIAGISQKQWKTLNESVMKEAVRASYKSMIKNIETHNILYKQEKVTGYKEIMKEHIWIARKAPGHEETSKQPSPAQDPGVWQKPATKPQKGQDEAEKASPKKPTADKPVKTRGRRYVFGHSMTSMLHWMGHHGVDPDVAYGVVTSQPGNEDVPMAVVKAHTGHGRKHGYDGDELDSETLSKLRKACGIDKAKKKSKK